MTELHLQGFPDLVDYDQDANWCHEYAHRVLEGSIPSCKHIWNAAQRHLDDLESGHERGLYFDQEAAQHVVDFYQFIKHNKGELAGQSIQLLPWQIFICGSLFGWKRSDGTRRFRSAYVEVARKNGKSTLSSGLALYMLAADGEGGSEVYSAATTRDQAKIVFTDAQNMVKKSPELREAIKTHQNAIFIEDSASTFRPLAADANNLDGLNVHFAVLDELHAHKTREVYDVIETATGSRAQPLVLSITTAGFNKEGICYEIREYVESVLSGRVDDDSFFGVVYSLDEGDEWSNEDNWYKANPCLHASVKLDDIQRLAKKAAESPASLANFLTKRLNIWVNSSASWLDINEVQACADPDLSIETYKGRECYIGVDLASKTDLAAISIIFPESDGGITIFQKHYLPEDAIQNAPKQYGMLYTKWAEAGYLILTEGSVLDHRVIQEDVARLAKEYQVLEVAYDPYNATQFAVQLDEQTGLPVVEVNQGIRALSESSKTFEALIKSKKLKYSGDPVFEWCCSNAVIYVDVNENIKVRKEEGRPHNKIDSVIASIIGLSRTILEEPEKQYTGSVAMLLT